MTDRTDWASSSAGPAASAGVSAATPAEALAFSRPRPILVLVGGPPGAGKTTLAERLGEALALPVLTKDTFKETLADALGAEDLEQSRALSRAAFVVLFATVGRLLAAGVGVVAEANYSRGLAEPELAPLVAAAPAVLLHCQTTEEVCLRRVVERHERGQRHPCHLDGERLAEFRSGGARLTGSHYESLDLGVPTLRVDTTDGYVPGFDAIVEFVRSGTDRR